MRSRPRSCPDPSRSSRTKWAGPTSWRGLRLRRPGTAAPLRRRPLRPDPSGAPGGAANYIRRMILHRFLVADPVAIVHARRPGIGAATAVALAEAGADVVLAARTEDQLREVAKKVEATGRRA